MTERRYRAPAFFAERRLPLHYFHISNGTVTLDTSGTDLATLADVRREAIRAFRELLHLGKDDDLWSGEPWKLWVTNQPNASGQTILTLEVCARQPVAGRLPEHAERDSVQPVPRRRARPGS